MLYLPYFKRDNSVIRRRPLIRVVVVAIFYAMQKIPLPFGVR